MNRIQIERKSNVLPADIVQQHFCGLGKPVVITDATENWPARSKWTFEFLKATYGSDLVTPSRGFDIGTKKLTTLSAYIDFLDAPMEDLPGVWTGRDIRDGRPPKDAPGTRPSPLYLYDWYALRRHPELYDDITPTPYFVPDLLSVLSPTLRGVFECASKKEYTAVFIGPEGSLSALHRDYWDTHAYLAQIQGRKRAILFSPEDEDFLYDGQVDPEQPDLARFPLFEYATAYECIIQPGDTLLIPANWSHHVRGLEKSITVSHSFFNESNFSKHMIHILRNLPTIVDGIDRSSEWREELGIEWRSADFAADNTVRS